jgi:hypothetical protein
MREREMTVKSGGAGKIKKGKIQTGGLTRKKKERKRDSKRSE